MNRSWQEWASARDYRMVCGDPAVLDEVRAEIDKRRAAGELDETFYQESLSSFRYLDEADLPDPRTAIVLAVRRPAHLIPFETQDGLLEAILPPTYGWYVGTRERIGEELTGSLLGKEHRLVALQAPLKSLAARLGLVTYGRNNITYVPEFGSYHQLVGFLTDAELGPWSGGETKASPVSPACQDCRACLEACPTGAIRDDRFLLRAERCLTLFTEIPGPWPVWLPSSAHHCLVGCLVCQKVCPQNTGKLRLERAPVGFTRQESACILSGEGQEADPIWDEVRAKLARLGLVGYEPIVGRNLRALLANDGAKGTAHLT